MKQIFTRTMLAALFALSGFLLFTQSYAAEKQRVVYHVADEAKVMFALNNIRNHIKGVGGKNLERIVPCTDEQSTILRWVLISKSGSPEMAYGQRLSHEQQLMR